MTAVPSSQIRPEIARLIRQAVMVRPITQRFSDSAGIGPGMRVFDIGCGPGDVSLQVADLVGPAGRVFGIDPNGDAIAPARWRFRDRGHTNAEFLQSDVRSYAGAASFDAAVCRYVLIHQIDPSAFLKVTRRLGTGGVIALHEADTTRGIRSKPPLPLLHEVYSAVHQTITRAGTAIDVGGRPVFVFREAGLPVRSTFSEAPVDSGADSQLLRWMVALAREVLPYMFRTDPVTTRRVRIETLLDRLQRRAESSSGQLEFAPQMCAWVRV